MKEKLLYLMHVPWGFIKQRPHFVGESLNDVFDVTVYCLRHTSDSGGLTSNEIAGDLKVKTLWVSRLPKAVNRFFGKLALKKAVQSSKYIWVTYPKMFDFVKDYLTEEHTVIYDCMDDALEFPGVKKNPKKRDELQVLERELCSRCDIIFTSAYHLRKKLLERYQVEAEVKVVNNGLVIRDSAVGELPVAVAPFFTSPRKKLVYIGTVAEWIDFDLILESLARFEDIEYIFVGFLDATLPAHSRIKYAGPVEHRHVVTVMEKSDVLIMPFVINDLILGVNPVKVYEYIYSNKPAIIKRYPETEQFRDHVLLYKDRVEYLAIIEELVNDRPVLRHTAQEAKEFLAGCTWDQRVKVMVEALLDIESTSADEAVSFHKQARLK